jgi:hypothetical protein
MRRAGNFNPEWGYLHGWELRLTGDFELTAES